MATSPTQIENDSTPKMSYRTQREFEMRSTKFPKDVDAAIAKWLEEQIKVRRKQLERRHKNLVPEWRRLAEGKPKEEKKSWPFENCANLVHQLIGEANDDLAARVMGVVWATAPIALFRYFTKSGNEHDAETNSRKSKLLEQAMDYFAYDPNELDLWNKENIWFSTGANIGTSWLCVVPEQRTEAVYIGYEEKKGSKFEDATLYEGPKVLNLRDEDVLYDPDADTPEDSDFLSKRGTLRRRDLQEREFKGLYKKGSVSQILGHPDRYGPDETQRKASKSKGVVQVEERVLAEWDIEECYFSWYHNKKKFKLIAWFHVGTKTVLNQVFNFIPDNQLPLVRTRLSSGEKGMNGRGLADMGRDAQEEVSTAKNQRTDAITWGILGLNRISPQNKNIDKNFKIFPGAAMPFGKDDFEHFSVGEPAMSGLSLQNEEGMIRQARERFGIGPAVAGDGAGKQMDKKGHYGSMGTLAVMQDSNTRVAHRTSDFRHSHVKLVSLLTDFYGFMGLGRKGSIFGLDDKLLSEALADHLERRVRIPIRAATASANREVTKQNELLLNAALGAYIKETSTMYQAAMNAQLPPLYKKWLTGIIKARTRLMQQIIRDFQLSDQPEEFVPNVEFEGDAERQKERQTNAQEKGIDPGVIEMAKKFRGVGAGAVPGRPPGMAEPSSGL